MNAAAVRNELRRTPLHAAHRRLGARMVEFGGWDMPVQYRGILEEHAAVRTRAGLFDVSHMGEVEVLGREALAVCQRLVTNDTAKLTPGDAQYTALCNPSGGIVDDVIYYRIEPDRFFFCVNAANREKDYEWIRDHADGAEVVNRSDDFAQLALQGPRAAAILEPLSDVPANAIRPFRIASARVAGIEVLLSRTGYTGEDGFELYVVPGRAEELWEVLLSAGKGEGLQPIGLGARDTLRLEAALMLYGNDIDDATSPLEAGLGWVVKLDKSEFIGREALVRQKNEGLPRRLVGIEMEGAAPPRHGYPIVRDGRRVGVVTSGTKSPTLGKGIALAYLDTGSAAEDAPIEVEIRGRLHPAHVVRLPFYRRSATRRS